MENLRPPGVWRVGGQGTLQGWWGRDDTHEQLMTGTPRGESERWVGAPKDSTQRWLGEGAASGTRTGRDVALGRLVALLPYSPFQTILSVRLPPLPIPSHCPLPA